MGLSTIFLAFACAAAIGCVAAIGATAKSRSNRMWKIAGSLELGVSAVIATGAFLDSFTLTISAIWMMGTSLLFGLAGWACFAGEKRSRYSMHNWINLLLSIAGAGYVWFYIPL